MALYAYRDKSRTDVLYASEAVKEDRNKRFYCPNPACDAHLYICAIDGSKQAYFRATKPNHGHVDGCEYGESNAGITEEQFDETQFVYEDAIDNLFSATQNQKKKTIPSGHTQGKPKKHPPRTIRQIYFVLKQHHPNQQYGDRKVADMLLDDRSVKRYPKGCFGKRIIEAYAKQRLYDVAKKQIYLTAPLTDKTYTFILEFDEPNTFYTIKNTIYNNREKKIVVAGDWKRAEKYNHFISIVNSRKQIAIIK